MEKLNGDLDESCRKDNEDFKKYVKKELAVDHGGCKEMEKSTRQSSVFGYVLKRRKSTYPKSIVSKIRSSGELKNSSCQSGIENEKNALIKYHNLKKEVVEVCAACGLVVNSKWPWLASMQMKCHVIEQEKNSHLTIVI